MNQSICAILQHLFDNYSNITPLELEDNDTKMRTTWDPNSPFDCLVKQIEDGQDYADDGGQPYTAEQLLHIAYTLVFETGLYFEDCKTWNARPSAQYTWDNFKRHFQTAQRLLRDQMRTTKQAGFHSNLAQLTHPLTTQPPAEYQEALINLASSAAADRELLTKLATSVAAINHHINKLNHHSTQPPPLVQTDNDTTTTSTALSSVTTSLTELQQQLNDLKKMRLSGTITHDDPDPGETMEIIAGHMGIALETNTPAKYAKTMHQATMTGPPTTTPWAAAKPTNLNTYDIQGGVFFHLRIT